MATGITQHQYNSIAKLTDLLQPPVGGHLVPTLRPAGLAHLPGYDAQGLRQLVPGQGSFPGLHVPIF